jgi:hypothetical protein
MRDSRSLAYPFRAPARRAVVSVDHTRHIPILDQGDLGSCEGNAETGIAATSPVFDALPAGHPVLDENEAVTLYEAATANDGFPGTYPPDDTGTDSTTVSKMAQRAGLIAGYTHGSSVDDLLQALMISAVNFAFGWYDDFDNPNANGLVAITANGTIRGGHALCARGVDAERKLIWLDNSWTAGWGLNGRFCMSYDTADRLIGEDGEVVAPVPLSEPPPSPQPPGPGPDDPALAAFLDDQRMIEWASRTRTGENKYAVAQFRRLRAAEGR